MHFDPDGEVATSHLLTKQEAEVKYINTTGDVMSGELNMNGNRITNLCETPMNDLDAVCKKYVDEHIAAPFDELKNNFIYYDDAQLCAKKTLNMSELPIIRVADPTENQDAATKQYVDALVAKCVSSEEAEVVSTLNMNSKKIVNLDEPAYLTDAATKQYVDNKVSEQKLPRVIPFRKYVSLPSTATQSSIVLSGINIGVLDNNSTILVFPDYFSLPPCCTKAVTHVVTGEPDQSRTLTISILFDSARYLLLNSQDPMLRIKGVIYVLDSSIQGADSVRVQVSAATNTPGTNLQSTTECVFALSRETAQLLRS
jgi:hypothetical protein